MLAKKHIKSGVLAGAALAAGLFVASPAHAKLVLTFSETGDPGSPYVVNGTTSGGINSASITDPSTLGLPDFHVTIATGESNEPATSGIQAVLESSVLTITDSAKTNTPVTITVTLMDGPDGGSDPGYVIPGSSGSTLELDSSLGGSITKQLSTGTDTISFQSTANGSATPGAQSTSFTTAVSNASFNIPDVSTTFVRGAGYTLSNTVVVTLSNSGDSFTLAGLTTAEAVPEPTTISLGALAACGLLIRRRKRIA